MGAHARDHVIHNLAGLQLGRRTTDIDFAVAVPSNEEFRERTKSLTPLSDSGMSFSIRKFAVDLIPFRKDRPVIITEITPGVLMDTTGIAEAFTTATPLDQEHPWLRLPTLQAMIVLKTVAWRMRRSEVDKDATDLGLLLDCVSQGVFADRCFEDGELLERFEGDPDLVGAHLTGRDIAQDLPAAAKACHDEWLDARLVSSSTREPLRRQQIRAQLEALHHGWSEATVTTP
ncbi:hypothetical protein AAEX63_00250 [Luteococcus sp. H138]|uniref:hypothetical protein n=1 Tax=unclassified Luteococcus TaxID=2639923 RepID=UPI00313BB846